ncbi:hypothetical protein COO72_01430 [Bifidobacterium callitrichos]|nr:hypothetical protein COO72_01430 [Bifidobacterium callitrichos]
MRSSLAMGSATLAPSDEGAVSEADWGRDRSGKDLINETGLRVVEATMRPRTRLAKVTASNTVALYLSGGIDDYGMVMRGICAGHA